MEVDKMCQVHDIREIGDFIQMFLYDGFTLECLSKTMNIPIEWLEECVSDNPPKEVKKLLKLKGVFNFLIVLYGHKNDKQEPSSFLTDLLDSCYELYGVPKKAIGAFLGLNDEQFDSFLHNPQEYPDGFQLSTEMLRVLLAFSVDKSDY